MRNGLFAMMGVVCLERAAAAAPAAYTLTIGGTDPVPTFTGDAALIAVSTPGAPPTTELVAKAPAGGVTLTVLCTAPLDCTKLGDTLVVNGTPEPTLTSAPPATTQLATYAIADGSTFKLLYKSTAVATHPALTLDVAAAAAGGGAGRDQPIVQPSSTGTVRTLATTRCQSMVLAPGPREVFVTPLGTPLTPLPELFDETETLTVTVIGDTDLLPSLQVTRKSTIRVVTSNILGEDQQLPKLNLHAEHQPCAAKSFSVANFAPGTGDVIIVATGAGDPVTLGEFQFIVDPVYVGMFSIGAAWTPLLSPDFTVAMRNGQQVIVQSESGDRRMAYTLLFTPFLWEGLERDVRKPMTSKDFYHHLNPSVGFLLDDPLNNLMIGATFDLQSTVLFTFGGLFSHVKELDGLNVGDTFSGMTSDLPTHRHWKSDWFFGVSVDLRVGVKLLRMVLGTASGTTP